MKVAEKLGLRGRVEIFAYRDGVLFDYQDRKNIILYQGNAEIIRTISSTSPSTKPRIITRMAIGDLGTIPSDPTVPKTPVKTQTGLFHEVFRKDIQSANLTLSGATNQCQFITTFAASEVVISAYSNPSQPRINEVGLVIIDPTAPGGLVRTPVTAPTAPLSDEVLASIRCFKSVPFDVANNITITIKYTIFME